MTQAPLPSVNSISPSSGEQGEYLSVSISTTNIGLDDFSGSTSQFRFSQGWNNIFYGNQSYSSGSTLYGYVSIPTNQNAGFYDVEVYDYNTNSWVTSPDLFGVTQAPLPSVNSISPSSGEQGEYLSVSISTTNIGLDDFSGSTSQFRFSQGGVIPSMETQAILAVQLSMEM